METIKFKGTPCHTSGKIPAIGDKAPSFCLTGKDLNHVKCCDFAGKRIVLNIFPSLDTPVCAMSVRKFNQEAAKFDNTVVICVSMDLPFAMSRFCAAENIEGVIAASAFRSPEFGCDFGLKLTDGPLAGLLTRAVIILDENLKVIYTDLVEEITNEPNYEAAFKVLERSK